MTGDHDGKVDLPGSRGVQIGDANVQKNYFGPVTQVQAANFPALPVPVAVAVRDPEPIFDVVNIQVFTGRHWLTREIDEFLAMYPSGYVFIEADAGLGKTAFAGWLVKNRGYLSHFSRYSGGQSGRVALRNLSAQLVIRYNLAEFAPGEMLPDWAQSTEGFEFLLGKAAEKARLSERPLVLVVDGLDEAEQPDDGLPFGLPKLLPAGTYVIGTHRTGSSPGQPGSPAITARIARADPRNTRDIAEFLNVAAAEESLAGRLAEVAIAKADFIRLLTERSDGVWVYLRYALEELRNGLRRADTIDDLPRGLHAYYAYQILRWQRDPAWENCLLPLLATLGAAGEPLSSEMLSRLAGNLKPSAVRHLCDVTFRPILTVANGGHEAPFRYEIYHASFRQVLKAEYSEVLAAGELPYKLETLGDQLRQATAAAHSRIADGYLASFGGLNEGLAILAGDPAAAGADDGYPLRHLIRHLHHAGRTKDIQHLLSATCLRAVGRPVNVWFAAHDKANYVTSYLDDLSWIQSNSAAVTGQAIARNQPAPSLGTEIRFALMASSVTSSAGSISPELLDLLIRTGHWPLERALNHARRVANPYGRIQALMIVHKYTDATVRLAIAVEALDALGVKSARAERLAGKPPRLPLYQIIRIRETDIRDDQNRSAALIELAPYLPPGQLGRALDAVTTINDDYPRELALTGLAPYLPADQLTRALDAALSMSDGFHRARALKSLAPYLPSDQLARALDIAINGNDNFQGTLTDLAPYLPPDQLTRALDAAISNSEDYHRAGALTGLAPYLASDQIARAVDAAVSIGDNAAKASALAGLAPHLRREHIARAVDAALALAVDSARARALVGLVPHLPPDRQPAAVAAALDAVATNSDDASRAADTPTAMVFDRPAVDDLGSTLSAAFADAADSHNRSQALAILGAYLSPDQLARAVGAALAIGDDSSRARALTSLAVHLPPDRQPIALVPAFDAATAIMEETSRGEALTALAPLLPPDLLARALDATLTTSEMTRIQTLAALTPRLPPDLVAQALNAVLITDDSCRTQALDSLIRHMRPEHRPGLLTSALDTCIGINSEASRAQALTGLAPHLPPDDLIRALDAVTIINDRSACAQALTGLASYVPADQQPGVLDRALDAATAISDHAACAQALTGLASYVPAEEQPAVLDRALDAAIAISGDMSRASALAGLAPRLLPDQLARAFDAATAMRDDSACAHALAALAPHLPPSQQPAVLVRALDTALAISDYSARAGAFEVLAPLLPPDQLARALDAALAISDNFCRVWTVAVLAPHLLPSQQPAVLVRALDTALAISDYSARAGAFRVLGPLLPPDQLARALDAAAAVDFNLSRADAFAGLAPHLPSDLQPVVLAHALDAALAITLESPRARALAALGPYLSPDQLTRALDTALSLSLESARAEALAGLGPFLPSDQLILALGAALAIGRESARAEALTSLAPHLPRGHLARVLEAAASIKGVAATLAILQRSESILTPAEYADHLHLIRISFMRRDRESCLSIINGTRSGIFRIGGTRAIQECVKAIIDTTLWWP